MEKEKNHFSGLGNQKSWLGKMLKEGGDSQKEESQRGNPQTQSTHISSWTLNHAGVGEMQSKRTNSELRLYLPPLPPKVPVSDEKQTDIGRECILIWRMGDGAPFNLGLSAVQVLTAKWAHVTNPVTQAWKNRYKESRKSWAFKRKSQRVHA